MYFSTLKGDMRMKSLEELGTIKEAQIWDLIPKVILDEVEEAARARRFGRNLVRINEDLVRTKGREIVVGRRSTLSAGSVSEGASLKTSVNAGTLTYSASTIHPTKVGTWAVITQEAIEGCELNLIRDAITEAGIALANKEDSDIITELLTTSNTVSAVTNGTWSVNAYKVISAAVAKIRAANWSPKFLVIHPNDLKSILTTDMFIDASKYGSNEPILNGEIGKIAGLKVLVTTQIPDASNVALVVDPDRAAWMAIRRHLDMKRWDNPDTDSIELYFYTEYGVELTDSDACVKITDIS